jgi:MFS family permease
VPRGLISRLEAVPVPRFLGYGREPSLLLWSWLFWGFGQGLWAYLWPVYLADLGATPVEVGVVVATGSIVSTLCYLPGGYVAQLGHLKLQMGLGHLLPIVAIASFTFAQEWWHVLPGIVAHSTVGLVGPAVNRLMAQIADDESIPTPRYFTLLSVSLYVGIMVTPPVGGWLAERSGMAMVFPLVSVAYAASVLLMWMVRSRDETETTRDMQPGGARRRALAAGTGAYARLLSDPAIRLFLVVAFLLHSGAHLGLPFVPLYLEEIHGWDRARIGWVASAAGLGTVVLLLTMERFRRTYGAVPATWLASGFTGAHLGFTVLGGAAPIQAIGFFFRGGFQTMATLTTVGLTEMVPRGSLAPAIALLATVAGAAAISAPPLGGWLYSLAPPTPFLVGMAVLAVSAPLVSRALRRAPAPNAATASPPGPAATAAAGAE